MKELDLALEVEIGRHILATNCLFGIEYDSDAICQFCKAPLAKITLKEVYFIIDTDNQIEVNVESEIVKNVINEVETRLQSFDGKCPNCSSSQDNTLIWVMDSDEEKSDDELRIPNLILEVDGECYEVCCKVDIIRVSQNYPDCDHKQTKLKLQNVEFIYNNNTMTDVELFSEEGKAVIAEADRIINGIETTCPYCIQD